MKKSGYRDDVRAIVSGKYFWICVLLVVFLSYGFATFNMAVSRDDLQGYIYTGEGNNMLASGRFTIHLISRLFSSPGQGPAVAFTNDILAILGLIWAAINFCIFFRRVCGSAISNTVCTIFTCVFISYPLIQELWEYLGAYRVVAIGFLCDSFALLLIYDVLHAKASNNWAKILAACILMMFTCAGYESLVPVYIFSVFAILALQVVYGTEKEKKLAEIIRQGLCYAGVLVVGLILRVVVHKIILVIANLEPAINGNTEISWGSAPFGQLFSSLLLEILQKYILRSIIYFPLTELAVAGVIMLVVGIFLAMRHGWSILLPGVGMYGSLIALSLVQGSATPYRSCQVFSLFVAFTAMLIAMLAEKTGKNWIRIAVIFLCGYLCFHQADQMNYFLTLNYIRSEQEMTVIRNIGLDLHKNFDMDKPVIFVGDFTLEDEITEAASIPENSRRWQLYQKLHFILVDRLHLEPEMPGRKLPESNVNSVIRFGRWAFSGSQEAMQRLFSFCGYDYILPDCISLQPEADAYVSEHDIPCYPQNGYIQDAGDYIVVHIFGDYRLE